MSARHNFKKGLKCHFCKTFGHITVENKRSLSRVVLVRNTLRSHSTETQQRVEDSDEAVNHVLSANRKCSTGQWIINSGATSHICNDTHLFIELYPPNYPLEVLLGIGHKLTATAHGTVKLSMKSGQRSSRKCTLHDVLYIPSYHKIS